MKHYDVVVIGGGPAGLSSALAAKKQGAKVLLIEREDRLGGILKQCIHDGFGLLRYGEKLSGCEYASREMQKVEEEDIDLRTMAFVSEIHKTKEEFTLLCASDEGMEEIKTRALILATGCRERTAKQIGIHGSRPSGVLTAGTAQYYINVLGQLPGKRCVILGSGDIGLIMARRLTLEGAEVLGVYEAKKEPSGLSRNLYQCLEDFEIPLHLSMTVLEIHGRERVEGITLVKVDERMQPIRGTEEELSCDCVILSVGLIPENELAESLGVEIHPVTKGPVVDESLMTSVPGLFSCGNALHVNDLVDYVSESGDLAGYAATHWSGKAPKEYLPVEVGRDFLYVVPQRIQKKEQEKVAFFFRSRENLQHKRLIVTLDGKELFRKDYAQLKPPEMEKITLDLSKDKLHDSKRLSFILEDAQ